MAVENADWEQKAREWIETVGGFKLGSGSLQEELKNGIALCNFINVLQPGSVKKVSKLPGPFNQMENIKAFLDGVEMYGLAKEDTFVTVDLFEGRNMKQSATSEAAMNCYRLALPVFVAHAVKSTKQNMELFTTYNDIRIRFEILCSKRIQGISFQVIRTIYAIGRKAQEKNAPYPPLGPRESKENRRDFSKDQLEAGKHIVAMRF